MTCLNCSGPLLNGIKFCSRSCSVAYNNRINPKRGRRPEHSCEGCTKPTQNSRFCSHACERQVKHDHYVTDWLAGRVSGAAGSGVSKHVKRYLLETRGAKCQRCSWAEVHPQTNKVPVEVHHIGSHEDHSPENLQLLCPNCHSLTSTYRGLNRGHGRTARRS